jgi:hypothetical protein
VGRVIERFHMGKHIELSITDAAFTWQRRHDVIAQEAALDGLYVIRTQRERAAARCRGGGGRLQEPVHRRTRVPLDEDSGPARASGSRSHARAKHLS